MANYFVQVSLGVGSGLNEDEIVNTFSVVGGVNDDLIDGGFIAAGLETFYSTLSTVGMLSEWFTGPTNVAVYVPLLTSPWTLGSPVYFETINPTTGAGVGLPLEVALCLSFSAGDIVGVPARRRRGRVYIGPLGTDVLNSGDPPRPTAARVEDLADAGEQLLLDWVAESLLSATWSRTDGEMYPNERLWVDNEFDTMRSRGLKATARESRP